MPGGDGRLAVLIGDARVGTLARIPDGRIAFQYDVSWLNTGFSINPYSLPLENRVFIPEWLPFNGLFGVFNDSLPDGWGALLVDRMLVRNGVDPTSVDALERLAIVGSSGRGALRYEPETGFGFAEELGDLDEFAALCADILADKQVDDLDRAYAAGGSSGGARPKAYITDDSGSWIVKFPAQGDMRDAGKLEYDYLRCAQACGLDVPEYRLFPSRVCAGYVATRRFDIEGDARVHMLTASGAVEVSHRVPALDYLSLFQLSNFLTGSKEEDWRLFRLMCFNVFAHNFDDHSNNFTWLCHGGEWRLSPAYDLTFSTSFGNAHATSVLGEGRPGLGDVLALAKKVGLPSHKARTVAVEIRDATAELLKTHGLDAQAQ